MNSISSNYKSVRSTHGNRLFNQCIGQCDVKMLNTDNVTCEATSALTVNSARGCKEVESKISVCNTVYTGSHSLHNKFENLTMLCILSVIT